MFRPSFEHKTQAYVNLIAATKVRIQIKQILECSSGPKHKWSTEFQEPRHNEISQHTRLPSNATQDQEGAQLMYYHKFLNALSVDIGNGIDFNCFTYKNVLL